MNKTTRGVKVRKTNSMVIHQNHWCFISDYTSVKKKSTNGFHHESINQWGKIFTG